MSQYEVEMVIDFPDAQRAEKFTKIFETEMGYLPERDGYTVTCFLYRHGDVVVMRESAIELSGKVIVKGLLDKELK